MALAAIGVAAAGGLGVVSRSLVSTATSTYTSPTSGYLSSNYLRPRVLLTTLQGAYFQLDASLLADQMEAATPEPPSTSQSTLEPTATTEATPEPTPEPQPLYFIYTVQPGDTVEGIAAAFALQWDYLLWNNPELRSDPDLIVVGQDLLIPGADGLIYTVKLGDTLSDIAAFYGIDTQTIVAFAPNRLTSADAISEGMELLLPGAVAPPPPPPPPPPEPTPPPAPTPQPAAVSASGFIWPFVGSITSYFGEPRGGGFYHNGLDIDAFGRYGAPVVAAASGTVILAGWDAGGLGNRIVIGHDDGSETVYAHLSDMYVSIGQTVSQGETIGAIGCTGYCTGNHLHFEIHIGGVAVDPLAYLP